MPDTPLARQLLCACWQGQHRRLSTTDEGVNLDAILLSQDDEEDHHGAVEDRLRDGKGVHFSLHRRML